MSKSERIELICNLILTELGAKLSGGSIKRFFRHEIEPLAELYGKIHNINPEFIITIIGTKKQTTKTMIQQEMEYEKNKDGKTICPECMKPTSEEELTVFSGWCEQCSEEI